MIHSSDLSLLVESLESKLLHEVPDSVHVNIYPEYFDVLLDALKFYNSSGKDVDGFADDLYSLFYAVKFSSAVPYSDRMVHVCCWYQPDANDRRLL